MKTKDEIKKWLIKNAVNVDGDIDLSEIDFGDYEIILTSIKARTIYNDFQEARIIFNDEQKAYTILNIHQEIKKWN